MTEPGAPKRWSTRFVKNLMAILMLVSFLAIGTLVDRYSLGLDLQKTRCLPWTVYWVTKDPTTPVERGLIYQFRFKGDEQVANRNLLKFAAAVEGDRVRLEADGVWVNGRHWGLMHPDQVDRIHAMGKSAFASFVVPKGKLLMLGTLPQSYDSRYIGLVDTADIEGRARPLW